MNIYELIGVAFGLLSVYLSVRAHIWLWPTGIRGLSSIGTENPISGIR